MPIETVPFDAADYLQSGEAQLELLGDALTSGDAAYVASALGVIARARGMAELSKDTGIAHDALSEALSAEGDPKLSTLLGVLRALDFELSVASR